MPRRRRHLLSILAAGAAMAVAAAGLQSGAAQAKPKPAKPTKVVIIVVDALSKEIVDKYDMKNVRHLMSRYVDTPNGYLGHTGSVTVVTHNVITSGQLPKHMGWTSEGYRDVDNVLTGPSRPATPAILYITSDCDTTEFPLQQHAGYPKLDDYLDDDRVKQFTISPKVYAAYAFGSSASDSIIRFERGATCSVPGQPHHGAARPSGVNVPSLHHRRDCSNRFWVQRHRRRLRHHQAARHPLPPRRRPLRHRPRRRRTRAATSGRPTRRSRSWTTSPTGTASS